MNFVHSNPNVSISVGLVVNRRAVVGIVYLPVFDLMYTAKRDKGAWVNGEKIKVGDLFDLFFFLVYLVTDVFLLSRSGKRLLVAPS